MRVSAYIGSVLLVMTALLVGCSTPQVRSSISPKLYGKNPTVGVPSNNPLADAIGTELLAKGFRLIERSRLYNLIQEQALGQLGIMEEQAFMQAGKILQIDLLIFVNDFKDVHRPEVVASAVVRIVDVQSGEVLGSVNYQNVNDACIDNPADLSMGRESTLETASRIVEAIGKGFGR